MIEYTVGEHEFFTKSELFKRLNNTFKVGEWRWRYQGLKMDSVKITFKNKEDELIARLLV